MPYKDPEKQKEAMCQIMRDYRQRQKITQAQFIKDIDGAAEDFTEDLTSDKDTFKTIENKLQIKQTLSSDELIITTKFAYGIYFWADQLLSNAKNLSLQERFKNQTRTLLGLLDHSFNRLEYRCENMYNEAIKKVKEVVENPNIPIEDKNKIAEDTILLSKMAEGVKQQFDEFHKKEQEQEKRKNMVI